MVVVINYSDEKYRQAQVICTMAARYFGADDVIEYSPESIPKEFYQAHKKIMDQPRGNGYWVWKPYIILDALNKVENGDYVFYIDSGASLIDDVHLLIKAMEKAKTDIMAFTITSECLEKTWSKRDAFVLMNCDSPKYSETPQVAATWSIFKKSRQSINFVKEWLQYITDERIVTDIPNQMGKENYPGFQENRHDQTIFSLLAKKYNLPLFRIPALPPYYPGYPKDVIERSTYPQVVSGHHRLNFFMNFDEYVRTYVRKTSVIRNLNAILVLMNEGMYSEALNLLVRTSAQGGGVFNKI